MGFVGKGHEITDRRLVQGNMRQWGKQAECRSPKQNADSFTERTIQNRNVENGKSEVEENRGCKQNKVCKFQDVVTKKHSWHSWQN